MGKLTSCLILILLIVFTVMNVDESFAKNTPTGDKSQPLKITYLEKEDSGFIISMEVTPPSVLSFTAENSELQLLQLHNGGTIAEEGMPLVPVSGRLFRLPPRGRAVVEILNVEYETIEGINVAAWLGENSPVNEAPDELKNLGLIKNPRDSWFPGKWAEVAEPAILHDFRVATMNTYPVQVNSARREARIATNIDIRVRYEDGDDRNTIPSNPTVISETFLPFYRQFLDWDENELDEYTLKRGKVQVVLRDNEQLMTLMQPWFEWKLQRGWELELLTDDDVNWSAGNIQNELEDRFEDDPFDYIVIIGDNAGPFSTPPGSGQGDHEYVRLAGNDRLADAVIGRISVDTNNQLTIYINKLLYYEKELDETDTDWLARGAASTSMGGLTSTRSVGRYVCQVMEEAGYTQVDTAWWGGWLTDMRNALEDGVGYYSHRGNSRLHSAANDHMTPLVVEITCGPGTWVGRTGDTEIWMRAGTFNVPRGSIATISTATAGTHTRFNNIMTGGAAYSAYTQRVLTTGQVHYGAKKSLFDNCNVHDGGSVLIHEFIRVAYRP